MGFTFVNFLKISYRSEPLFFSDLKLFHETMTMQGKYDIMIDKKMVGALIFIVLLVLVIKFFLDLKVEESKTRVVGGLVATALLVTTFFGIQRTTAIYEKQLDGNDAIMTQLEQYMQNGFIYPFTYSAMGSSEMDLQDYQEDQTEDIINQYTYQHLPEDKQVHIVAVMLEAFADFSEFEELDFLKDPYEVWHDLEERSISGELLVNVFGGGTINTELSFLNGTYLHKDYQEDTNSYFWYFRNEGYDTYGMHPSDGWFYDRYNVYDYLGANEYLANESYFEEKGIDDYGDHIFFQEIINVFEEKLASNKPQFNFSVTYQNHGPYPNHFVESNQFVAVEDHQDIEAANILNNYLAGIWNTDQSLPILLNHFEGHEEPVILILFGDHMPWLEEGDRGYRNFGINTNVRTLEGYLNYYTTPFIIHGNQAAKEMFSREFVGDAGLMSPHFLMNYIMNYLGYPGDEYNQFLTDITKHLKANTESVYYMDGEFIQEPTPKDWEVLNPYFDVQRYWLDQFRYEKTK